MAFKLFKTSKNFCPQYNQVEAIRRDPNFTTNFSLLEKAKSYAGRVTLLTPDAGRLNRVNVYRKTQDTEFHRSLIVTQQGVIEIHDRITGQRLDDNLNDYLFNDAAVMLYEHILKQKMFNGAGFYSPVDRFFPPVDALNSESLRLVYESRALDEFNLIDRSLLGRLTSAFYVFSIDRDGNTNYSVLYGRQSSREGLSVQHFNSIEEIPDQKVQSFHEDIIEPILEHTLRTNGVLPFVTPGAR